MTVEEVLKYCTDGAVLWLQQKDDGTPGPRRLVLLCVNGNAPMTVGILRNLKSLDIVAIPENSLITMVGWKGKPEIIVFASKKVLERAARAVREGTAIGESWIIQDGAYWEKENYDGAGV
mgnify:CR=1 FL=1